MPIRADRRLCFTADGEQMVDDTDPRAAFLAYPEGRFISPGDVEKYDIGEKDGRVVLNTKMVTSEPATKDVEAPEDKAAQPDWPLSMSPAEYLERYGEDAKNSALARQVLEAEG